MIKLIATDLDNTLLDKQGLIPDSTAALFNLLDIRQYGRSLVIAANLNMLDSLTRCNAASDCI